VLRLTTIKSQLNRRWMVQLLLVVVAVVTFCSWKWLLERSLQNERDAWLQRFRIQQEQHLEVALEHVREDLEKEREGCLGLLKNSSSIRTIRQVLANFEVVAVVVAEPEYEEVFDDGLVFEDVTALEVIPWVSDLEGRDNLAARLIQFSTNERIWALLQLRLSGEVGPPMKPSFRHWLIEEAKEVRGMISPGLYLIPKK